MPTPGNYSNFDVAKWQDAGLKDFGDYAESVEYVNQIDGGGCGDSGDWYYADEENLVIYSGHFGNDESPGANVYADVYDDEDDFLDALAEWEDKEEWLDGDDWDDFDDDNDDYDDEEEYEEEECYLDD